MQLFKIGAALLLAPAFIAGARAQDVITIAETHWAGVYGGGYIGCAWNHTLHASKGYDSSGFNVGVGLDYNISRPWWFTSEYNYVNLRQGG